MGLLERVSTLVRANLNALLERAEDPEKVVKQLLIDMNNQLIQVRTQVATGIADERKLRRLWDQNESRAEEWRQRAQKAVGAGNDDLAKQCLSRVMTYSELADGFHKQYDMQAQQAQALKDALQQLTAKVQSLEARKDLLIARSRQAKASAGLQKALAQASDLSGASRFQQLEERVAEQEARAEALIELDSDTLEAKMQQIEQEEELDRQLQNLKAAMQVEGGAAVAPQLGAGAGGQ